MDCHKVSIAAIVMILVLTSPPRCTSSMTSEERHRVSQLERSMEVLSRQLMMVQLSQEEMRRSDGDSGIKQVRLTRDGTHSYHTNTHSGRSMAAMHDHANMPSTCGLGEIEAVLNGVHFRTRHNDYLLRMPASTGEYHATAAIPFPEVPPAVLQKDSVEEQGRELRAWFKAWKDGDTSKRDYRPYFKPLLCYLEGAWTTDTQLEEPLHNQRHHVDATDYQDLQEKIRFTSYTGDKHLHENLAYLPSMLLNVTDGVATVAHWNYRVLCHPVTHEVKLRDLRPVDDLATRLANQDGWKDYVMSRAARFSLSPFSDNKVYKWTLLDKIMKQIPGKNNYGSRLVDKSGAGLKLNAHNTQPLNTAYYHRWYKLRQPSAMGQKVAHTGFADRNLFVAETTQPRVAPMDVTVCAPSGGQRSSCVRRSKRVSYAIPLEIVFLTPLQAWNPYHLQYKGHNRSPLGLTVTAEGRTGKVSVEGAYNGTNSRHFYHTPLHFFQSGKELDPDPADTVKGVVGVLDPQGEVRSVVASGVRILLPKVKGVGVVRTRYPIMPVYGEGGTAWKEVEALREVVMDMERHQDYFTVLPSFLKERQPVGGESGVQDVKLTGPAIKDPNPVSNRASLTQSIPLRVRAIKDQHPRSLAVKVDDFKVSDVSPHDLFHPLPLHHVTDLTPRHVTLVTSPSRHSYVSLHVHTVEMGGGEWYTVVREGGRVKVRTTLDGGHSHLLEVGFDPDTQYFVIHACDHQDSCWDGHSAHLEKVSNNGLVSMSSGLHRYG